MKLTEWYPAHIKPVRKGVYETKCLELAWSTYQYWNGERWGGFCKTIHSADTKHNRNFVSSCQNQMWRGIAK